MNPCLLNVLLLNAVLFAASQVCCAFTVAPASSLSALQQQRRVFLQSQTTNSAESAPTEESDDQEEEELDYTIPEDAVIQIRPNAMNRLRELRSQQKTPDDVPLYLRMGVKSGGCSGMSYVMDFCADSDVTEDDVVDDYETVHCVVDPKSVLYLYGLELDYSSELIGGGFKFFNPNAEESCGCGSSFGI